MNVHGGVYGQAQHKVCLIFIVFLKHSWYNLEYFLQGMHLLFILLVLFYYLFVCVY